MRLVTCVMLICSYTHAYILTQIYTYVYVGIPLTLCALYAWLGHSIGVRDMCVVALPGHVVCSTDMRGTYVSTHNWSHN